jgi:hypothetical protein
MPMSPALQLLPWLFAADKVILFWALPLPILSGELPSYRRGAQTQPPMWDVLSRPFPARLWSLMDGDVVNVQMQSVNIGNEKIGSKGGG